MYAPGPIQLVVWPDITVTGVVNNQKVVGTGIIQKRGHLHSELDTRVRYSRDGPSVGVVVVALTKDLLQGQEILLDRRVFLPSQHQDRHAGVFGFEGLLLDVDGGILEMAGEGLELIALGQSWGRFGMGVGLW